MAGVGLTFGIYPLGVAGTPTGLAVGPKDDYNKIQLALQELKGDARTLLPRNYVVYTGPDSEDKWFSVIERYSQVGLLGDLTLGCFQDNDMKLDYWLNFIHEVIRRYGSSLDSVQITNEPNLTFMDGSKPYVLQALVQGVLAAKKAAQESKIKLNIGFGSVPEGPKSIPHFWESIATVGGKNFVEAVDYVGHNFYVDVFEEPVDIKEIPTIADRLLRNLRKSSLRIGGIPASVPIRITENGWPTGRNPFIRVERTYERQAIVLEAVIRSIYNLRQELNISHYELFGLRDADSTKDELFHQFGIMRDDYTPKPAFYTFQRLIQELGV